MSKISVIIPCYNVENYIDRCLESVVGQTIGLDKLEIIVVNDASADSTLKKLQDWEKQYPQNIMVITYEENIRQGGARNIGLSYATGEYIGFVDSDDWIEPDMYQVLYEKMQDGEYDVVECKFIRDRYLGEHTLTGAERKDKEYHFTPRNGVFYGECKDTGNCGEYGSICTMLVKKELLQAHEIYFPERMAYEDNYWRSIVRLYVERQYIVDKICYHYFVNSSSTVTAVNGSHQLDRLEIELLKVEELKRRGALEVFHQEIEWEFIQKFYLNTWFIIFTRFSYIPEIFGEMKEKIQELFPGYQKNPYLKQANAREQQLLRLLEFNHKFSTEELEKIKWVYLASMRG